MRLAERILNPSDQIPTETLEYVGRDDLPKWVKEGTMVISPPASLSTMQGASWVNGTAFVASPTGSSSPGDPLSQVVDVQSTGSFVDACDLQQLKLANLANEAFVPAKAFTATRLLGNATNHIACLHSGAGNSRTLHTKDRNTMSVRCNSLETPPCRFRSEGGACLSSVKVKTTARTRFKGGNGIDARVWAGEIGKVGTETGNGWWRWIIHFDRGRDVILNSLGRDDLDYFVKYTKKT